MKSSWSVLFAQAIAAENIGQLWLQLLSYFQIKPAIDINHPSDTGNTALHAAANNGNVKLVVELLKSPNINMNCQNPQCENAAPIHLAVMHGM